MGCLKLSYCNEERALDKRPVFSMADKEKNASRSEICKDYYAGGMLMPGRSFSSNSYRFGFNNQEKDDEITGTTGSHYEFKLREYDSRIGKFWSIDPLTAQYPFYSPYAFAGNSPIKNIDLEGAEPIGCDLIMELSMWYAKLKVGTSDLIQAGTKTGNYNNQYVPTDIQNKVRLSQAAKGANNINKAVVSAGENFAETISSIPGVDLIGDPLLAAYYTKKGDYESATSFSLAAGLPVASGKLFKIGADALKKVEIPTTENLAKFLGIEKKKIHDVKETILQDHDNLLKKNKSFGDNPDIGYDEATGNTALQSRKTGDVIITDTPINIYKSKKD